MNKEQLLTDCKSLLEAYKTGQLGQTTMPEDNSPAFLDDQTEMRLAYFTLPMALNYQRDSYALWRSALQTWNDPDTKDVFAVEIVSSMSDDVLRRKLLKHKVALQPNKHIDTWKRIAHTVHTEWGSFSKLMQATNNDFLLLRDIVQARHKKGFPYVSGPKIFNYWSFILGEYGKVDLRNKEHIEIAPDTHITQCSVQLGVLTENEAKTLSKEAISERWRNLLDGSGISPIEMHPPLWFWSRNGFLYKLR